jgi:hypothetical protein
MGGTMGIKIWENDRYCEEWGIRVSFMGESDAQVSRAQVAQGTNGLLDRNKKLMEGRT